MTRQAYHSLNELQADLDCWMRDYNAASYCPSLYVVDSNRPAC
jgi:hypothetical protein